MTPSLGTSLKNDSIVNQLIEKITGAILQGTIRPGERMPSETELTAMFQVGKSSVREAIKVLQAVGILEVRRGDGTYVSTGVSGARLNPVLYQLMMEPLSIEKLFELRRIFEPAYTSLAVTTATEEDLLEISAAKENYESLVELGMQKGEHDIAFHRSILRATHNPYIESIGEMILKILAASVEKGSVLEPRQAVADHRRIYEALIARDSEAAAAAVVASFEGWMKAAGQNQGKEGVA